MLTRVAKDRPARSRTDLQNYHVKHRLTTTPAIPINSSDTDRLITTRTTLQFINLNIARRLTATTLILIH